MMSHCNANIANILKTMNRYYMPTMISLGLVGNSICILVFALTRLKSMPSCRMLASLAAVDLGAIFISLLHLVGGKATSSTNGACQILFYAYNVFCFLSVYFVCAFTLERYLAVRFPLRRLKW
uniref:G-protein coupled receptors family 1 profile domain-containing protein n=1 Tax=Romanomermis culicivorax TaxID=13658 RepID=A0A915J8Q3_ROMCU